MPAGGPAISRALQVNEVEKHSAAMREHVEEPYRSRTLPTIGERGYCPIIPANTMVVNCGWESFRMDANTGEKTGNMKIPPAQSEFKEMERHMRRIRRRPGERNI